MIKVIVTNTTQASELIKAFNGRYYNVEIVVKENTVGQDDVILINSIEVAAVKKPVYRDLD